MLLSVFVLLLGFGYVKSTFAFGHKQEPATANDFTMMTYNVRGFNYTKWSKQEGISDSIAKLVATENPDVVMFQEFHKPVFNVYDKMFLHKTAVFRSGQNGQAIFSNYKIVDTGEFNFKESRNNIIYADILIHADTVRFYNVHLETNRVTNDIEGGLMEADKSKMAYTLSNSFKIQQQQIDALIAQLKEYKGKVVIAGDFNNTAYSYIYNELKTEYDLQDSFEVKGSSFGNTYGFKYFPLRIDFVLSDKSLEVKAHKNYDQYYSDHYPVKVTFGLDAPVAD
ncbi:hypothetical protein Y10_27430 [Neptunitalea sp. Y10]|uniref:Endonuclease/exonuclease/phosphatase domain-containing protein n=2 Tax=Neptunitalea lumnitzerae TaxID=2965509 RepID=A0ABQ5MMQ2_9FLAO|nr:hypothetical protein Y10_27430 [Neptunitalea sp. Y10]